MPRAATSRTFRGTPRKAAVAASAALGAAALCLIVFGTGQRQLQLGVLLGLWSALVAACLIVATGHGEPGEESEAEPRRFGDLQFAREAAARRESELTLEISLRREIERVLSDQLGALREEVAALRAEMLDKLGGQLRLERIETTRVIGSDLEALQHEIRRLEAGSQPAQAVAARPPARQAGDSVHAELVEFPPPAVELASDQSAAERRAGRRRAPESEPPEVRYQGRRRADGDPAGRYIQAEG